MVRHPSIHETRKTAPRPISSSPHANDTPMRANTQDTSQRMVPPDPLPPKISQAPAKASLSTADLPKTTEPPNMETTARAHLRRQAARHHLTPETLSGARLRYIHDLGEGPIIAKFNQYVEEMEIFRQEINVMMARDGSLSAMTGHLSPHVATLENNGDGLYQARVEQLKAQFQITPEMAINRAFQAMGGIAEASAWSLQHTRAGYGFYTGASITGEYRPRGAVRLKKVLFDARDALHPAYHVELVAGPFDTPHQDAFSFVLSAVDGHLLFQNNLVSHASFSYRVYADATGKHFPMDGPLGSSGTPNPLAAPSTPVWLPEAVSQTLISWQQGPMQKQDPWLSPRATTTSGNNADAYIDRYSPDGYHANRGDLRAPVNGVRTFDYAYDPARSPMASLTQQRATIVQLFYMVNFMHDWFYDVGFDEASGNAQQDNYGRGGEGGDPLLAEAQDYDLRDNGRMMVPADGASPRMEMFLWSGVADKRVTIQQPAGMGPFSAGRAMFGPRTFQTSGTLVLMDDGVAPVSDGCESVINPAPLAGHLVMIDRGTCFFVEKVRHAQAAGALGVLVVDNEVSSLPLTMSGEAEDITLPSLFMTREDGQSLKEVLAHEAVHVTLSREEARDRSGAMDMLVVAHEWGHLISNRLIGNANGLFNNQGESLGEGWADFHALLFAVREEDAQAPQGDNFEGTYAIGSYATSLAGEGDPYYFGLRRVPYSTRFDKNALTFRHIENGTSLPDIHPRHETDSDNAAPHAAGEIWATMLWEVYAALLRDRERLTFGQAQKRMMTYLVAAYKMTPVDPTFTEARDALLAVAMASDPQDYLRMQKAFARRGLGHLALSPERYDTDHFGVKESFEYAEPWRVVDATLLPDIHTCDQDGILDVGETARLTLTLRNDTPVAFSASQVRVTAPGVRFAQDGILTLPEAQPGETVEVETELTLEEAAQGAALSVEMVLDEGWGGHRQTVWTGDVQFDLKPAFRNDAIDKPLTDWTMGRASEGGGDATWTLQTLEDGRQAYVGEDPDRPADFWWESPPLHVAEEGGLRFQFDHAHAFEADELGAWDGGVVELRVADGTWQDLGAFMKKGYNGTLLSSNPSLGDRAAFVGRSPGYPAWITETVTLGDRYHGQEVAIRFRIGADHYVGEAGWRVRNIRFENIRNLPFTALVNNAVTCDTPARVAEEGVYTLEGILRGLSAGDTVRLTAHAPSTGDRAFVDLVGQGGDTGFSLKVPPAPDYRLFVRSENYQDGYWGGVPGDAPQAMVPAFQATVLDLSREGATGLHGGLVLEHTVNVVLNGVREGDVWEVTAWSEATGGLVWREGIAQGAHMAITLPGVPAASDYLIFVSSPSEGWRHGFYTGEDRTVGSLLQAERLIVAGQVGITLNMAMGRSMTGHVQQGEGVRAEVFAWSEARGLGGSTILEEQGDYHLTGLAPARDYRVCVSALGWVGGCHGGADGRTVPFRLAVPVDLMTEDQEGIDLTLTAGQQIVGQVTGLAEGDEAWVEAWSLESGYWGMAPVVKGHFTLEGLSHTDHYEVTLMALGYQTSAAQKVRLDDRGAMILPNGETATLIHFEGKRGGGIEGVIHGLHRRDVVTVGVHSMATGAHREITLLAQDETPHPYALDGLPQADDYLLHLQTAKGLFFRGPHGLVRHGQAGKPVAVSSMVVVKGVDLVLDAEEAYTLSGTLTGLRAGDETLLATISAWSDAGDLGITQRVGNGSWSLTGLGPGLYHLAVQAPGYVETFFSGFTEGLLRWQASWPAAEPLAVYADIDALDVTLQAGHTLTGRVLDEDGSPAEAVRVTVWDVSQGVGGGATTLADGRFRIAGLADGRYQCEIHRPQGNDHALLDLLLSDRALGDLSLLSRHAGSIRGTIQGMAQVLVLVYAEDGTFVTATVTDSAGFYRVDNLVLGDRYRLDMDTDEDLSVMEGTRTVVVTGAMTVDMELPSIQR